MALITTEVKWHDLEIDPDDLPGEGEPILATLEGIDGERFVWSDVYYRTTVYGFHGWYTASIDDNGRKYNETKVWYPVLAWAYYPAPYYV